VKSLAATDHKTQISAGCWLEMNFAGATKEYSVRMTVIEGGKKLQVRGYIGPFYRTQVWNRIQ
jgi:Uncharacterized protein conserved in bacteria (DUF2147)